MEKLEGVLSTIINMYQDELKICKQIPSSSNNSNQSKQLEDDISVELEASINLLSSLDSSADSDSAVVLKATLETCSTTIVLVRKCMKLAIGKGEAQKYRTISHLI